VYSNEDVPFVAVYYDEHGKRVYSLRSRKGGVDVGKICESMGGGGHPSAAGFKVRITKAPLEPRKTSSVEHRSLTARLSDAFRR
jgi:nanoRNase/pAp phosphatase (c-di-AMP/oligoRNAs hydrolase)